MCEHCGGPVPPKAGRGGKPKRFCSLKCQQSARTERDRGRTGREARSSSRTRMPLPAFARKAGWQLRADIERIQRIVADDRMSENKHQVAAELRGHLENAVQVCQDLLGQLPQERK